MNTCRICGETLKLTRSGLKYGAKVHTCPKCHTPYVDPKIVELATVSEQDRAGYRLKYATEGYMLKCLAAAVLITAISLGLGSSVLVSGLLPVILIFTGSYIGLYTLCFTRKFFFSFPRLMRESKQRMADNWYLLRLKACYSKAA